MWMARVDQDLKFLSTDDLKVSVGGSYWYSDIENKKLLQMVIREIHGRYLTVLTIKNLNVVLTEGDNRLVIKMH